MVEAGTDNTALTKGGRRLTVRQPLSTRPRASTLLMSRRFYVKPLSALYRPQADAVNPDQRNISRPHTPMRKQVQLPVGAGGRAPKSKHMRPDRMRV